MISAQLSFLRWRNLGYSIYLHHIKFLILFSFKPTSAGFLKSHFVQYFPFSADG